MCEEDAFICDLAETYNIYDYESFSVEYISTLLRGLRDSSRTIMKLSEQKMSFDTMINVQTLDVLRLIWWSKTKDGHDNTNRPKMLMDIINGNEQKEDIKSFDSGEDLLEEFKRITRE